MTSSTTTLVFIVITFFYFILKLIYTDTTSIFYIYYVVLILLMFLLNIGVYSKLSGGETSVVKVLFPTFVPWILFGALCLTINGIPSIKIPFSHTLGYMMISVFGVNDLLKKMIYDPEYEGREFDKMLFARYELLLGEYQSQDFEKLKTDLTRPVEDKNIKWLWGQTADEEASEMLKNLRGFLLQRDLVGEIVWVAMAGILCVQLSYNMILRAVPEENAADGDA